MRLSAYVDQNGLDPFNFEDFVFVGGHAAVSPRPLIVVGGQALEAWGHLFNVPSPSGDKNPLTEDTDFLASKHDAHWLCDQLGAEIHFPSADDMGPSTALAYLQRPDGRVLMMDFLRSIVGPSNEEVAKWSVPIRVSPDAAIHVLHPLLCLESRMANLEQLPSKRRGNGPEQGEWAVSIVNAYLERMPVATPDDADNLAKSCRKLAEMAEFKSGRYCWINYRLDPLSAISDKVVEKCGAGFAQNEWPRVKSRILEKRERWEQLAERRTNKDTVAPNLEQHRQRAALAALDAVGQASESNLAPLMEQAKTALGRSLLSGDQAWSNELKNRLELLAESSPQTKPLLEVIKPPDTSLDFQP